MARGRPRNIVNTFAPPKSNTVFSEGFKSKGILDDFAVRKVVDSKEGTIQHTPTNAKDITNKEYVDIDDGVHRHSKLVSPDGLTDPVGVTNNDGDVAFVGRGAFGNTGITNGTALSAGVITDTNIGRAFSSFLINTKSDGNSFFGYGNAFNSAWRPTIGSASNRTLSSQIGTFGTLDLTLDTAETKDFTITEASSFDVGAVSVVGSTTGGGKASMTLWSSFKTRDPILNANGSIGTAIGFYDPGITAGTSSLGFLINTNSILNASVLIGAVALPAANLDVRGDTRMGDSTTNYTTVDATGNMVFVGGGGLPFAEIYCFDGNTTITISGTGIANKVQVTCFDTNGVSNNMTPDHTNDHITVTKAGMYKCSVSTSIDSLTGSTAKFAMGVFKNNGATHFQNLHFHRNLPAGAGGNSGSASMTGIIDLAVNDTIEVWAWNETNTQNFVVDDITMNLIQIGGT